MCICAGRSLRAELPALFPDLSFAEANAPAKNRQHDGRRRATGGREGASGEPD